MGERRRPLGSSVIRGSSSPETAQNPTWVVPNLREPTKNPGGAVGYRVHDDFLLIIHRSSGIPSGFFGALGGFSVILWEIGEDFVPSALIPCREVLARPRLSGILPRPSRL